MFHALTDEACRMMLGTRHDEAPHRHVIGRAFSHGSMKQACISFAGGTLKAAVAKGLPVGAVIPVPIRNVADMFVLLQDQRHLADYDRTERFRRSNVLQLIARAETAVETFANLTWDIDKKFLLVCLLTCPTLAGR
jgi:hypothetical protein